MVEEEKQESKEEQLNVVQKAEQLVLKMVDENKKFEELVARNEKAKVNELLAGRGYAQVTQAPKRKMTEIEYAKAFMDGKVKLNEVEPEV